MTLSRRSCLSLGCASTVRAWYAGLLGCEMPGNRRALVVGNSAYQRVSALKNPANDAADVAQLLQSFGFDVVLERDANSGLLERALNSFASRLRPHDAALFYYAGHGLQIEAENYIAPVDFHAENETAAKFACVPVGLVQERMEKTGTDCNFLILDACRDNPLRGVARSLNRGLAPMGVRLGTLIAYATSPGHTASENSGERNGLFTKHLLETLRQEPLPAVELFRKTREKVFEASNGTQRPWLHEDIIGDFYFAPRKPGVATAKPDSPAPGIPKAQELLQKGQALYRAGDYQAAVQAFDLARRINPENAYAHNGAGEAYEAMGLFAPAVECYGKAISVKPDYAAAYRNRGMAYQRVPRHKLAIEDLSWAIEQDSRDATLYTLRAQSYFGVRSYQEALEDFKQAIQLNPFDPYAFHGRGLLHARMGAYADAICDYGEALRRKPRLRAAYEDRAVARQAMGDVAGADADRQSAQRIKR